MKDIYKLELTEDERDILIDAIRDTNQTELYIKLLNIMPYRVSINKKLATMKATQVRSDRVIEKINNAINLLQFENKPITHNSIAITSGVSYNTVKKYIPDIDKIEKL